MVTMHGLFFLRDPSTEQAFKEAYDAFAAHLVEVGYVRSWRVQRRSGHDGYDVREPPQPYYCALDFHDLKASIDCYAYVEADQEPLKSLHWGVNQKVVRATTQFYLCEDL